MSYKFVDANEATADVAYRCNEVCLIYPITPASAMGELSDQWSAQKRPNIWDTVPTIVEMQSEGGVAGAIHGAVQTGALATTYTASQGLLLMIPNMFHLAAELTPTVFHIASRTVAYQGMSIYCDHSDVMATRTTGFAILCASSVQRAHDFALISQIVSLKTQIPFLHFFDGFTTSHQINKIKYLTDEQIQKLIPEEAIITQRNRRLCSERPTTRGLIYGADVAFQIREAANSYYQQLPQIFEEVCTEFKKVTGREHKPVEYFGAKDAERIIVIMGSGAETVEETVKYFNKNKLGLIRINLFQPFPTNQFLAAIPSSCKAIAVLDRTKECGAGGEPLYQKVATAIVEGTQQQLLNNPPKVIGGRYGIMGKEFNPTMVMAVFDELSNKQPKNDFTLGINDDITATNLPLTKTYNIESDSTFKAIFYGLGADGTVGANKNSIKIIGENSDNYVQAYFVYDAKKSGSTTISHLRFGSEPILANYLITNANFIGCHQFRFIQTLDVLKDAAENSTLLLNSPHSATEVWQYLPKLAQEQLIAKKIKFYVINAYQVAEKFGMGNRINTIMQTCFFSLTNIMPQNKAIQQIKAGVEKTYALKGKEVVANNYAAVDHAITNMEQVEIPTTTNKTPLSAPPTEQAPAFVQKVIAKILTNRGNELPVSFIPADGTFPTDTICWEKRNISTLTPKWDQEKCIQCGRCSLLCPHSCIRVKDSDGKFMLQIYHEECTGCQVCVNNCPVKALTMQPKAPRLEAERQKIAEFEKLPYKEPDAFPNITLKNLQYLQQLFEFSDACPGCGESPYLKIISQLFGDRMLIGNACGCSSVYGGILPTSPWAKNCHGCGPAWCSSLFEDNAEFAYGYLITELKEREFATELLQKLAAKLDSELVTAILGSPQTTSKEIAAQRIRITELKTTLATLDEPLAKQLIAIADFLLKHSIWAIGGDGWAYDIGFGGIDHVIASGKDINILVMDTEVYSNTGGQASKASGRGQVAKFTFGGKPTPKKELGLMAMTYQDVYVASIALGANPNQALKAIIEAEKYPGPSLIIAYSHCIAHGINTTDGYEHQKLAVETGYWPLYRFDPTRTQQGQNPFQLDSKKPSKPFTEFAKLENRYRSLADTNPEHFQELMDLAQQDIDKRWQRYAKLAE